MPAEICSWRERRPDNNKIVRFEFKQNCSINSHIVDMYLTGDLAFQAMALGKESMATWWCMQCKASMSQFMDENSEMWKWLPFIPLTNYVSLLLHCEI